MKKKQPKQAVQPPTSARRETNSERSKGKQREEMVVLGGGDADRIYEIPGTKRKRIDDGEDDQTHHSEPDLSTDIRSIENPSTDEVHARGRRKKRRRRPGATSALSAVEEDGVGEADEE